MAITHVAVVIPAHNEEGLIEGCVASVRRALEDPSLGGLARQIVVVADGCTDRTTERTWRALRNRSDSPGVILAVGFRSAGRARAAGVAEALRRWPAATATSVWLANTDADTTVPADWAARQIRAEQLGYAAVAGIVDAHAFPGHPRFTARRFRETYVVPDDGPHPHVHGCNIGVRADAYLDVGGWPPLDLAEDHGLWNALRARGWACRSDRWLEVITSGRRAGRAPGGFADTLAGLGAAS